MDDLLEQTAEQQFLLACVRSFLYPDTEEPFPSTELDWESLLELTENHRLTPILYEGLKTSKIRTQVPDSVFSYLRTAAKDLHIHNLALIVQLKNLIEALQAQAIRVLPFKGLSYAHSIYNNLGLREFADMDLLVRADDFTRASEILETRGFDLQLDTHWERHFFHERDNVAVDLHRYLNPQFIPSETTFETLWHASLKYQLAGFQLRSPSFDDALIIHCIHLVKDCWDVRTGQSGYVRLNKLCDIARGLTHANFNWERFRKRARELRAERMVLFCLKLAADVLAVSLPAELSRHIASNPLGLSFAQPSSAWFFGPKVGRSVLSGIFLQLRATDRRRDRLRLLIQPTREDTEAFPLPKGFAFVYFFTRPLRLFCSYANGWLKSHYDPNA